MATLKEAYSFLTEHELLAMLSDARSNKKMLESRVKVYDETEAVLRELLQEKMQRNGVRTLEGSELQVVLQRRTSVTIVDEASLINQLEALGVKESYMRLDVTKAKKAASENGWPGIYKDSVDTMVVREMKE